MAGWIKIYDSIQEHWIWQSPLKLKWWLDLIMLANTKDKKVNIGMKIYYVRRGQLIASISFLRGRWKYIDSDKIERTPSKLRILNFLEMLEADNMISRDMDNLPNRKTLISITNYNDYQDVDDSDRTTHETTNRTTQETKSVAVSEPPETDSYNANNQSFQVVGKEGVRTTNRTTNRTTHETTLNDLVNNNFGKVSSPKPPETDSYNANNQSVQVVIKDGVRTTNETTDTKSPPLSIYSIDNNINNNITNNIERGGKKTSRFVPPTVEEVKAYLIEKGYTIDPDNFVNFYDAKGWMIGKNKMKNWKASVNTWQKREKEFNNNQNQKNNGTDANQQRPKDYDKRRGTEIDASSQDAYNEPF